MASITARFSAICATSARTRSSVMGESAGGGLAETLRACWELLPGMMHGWDHYAPRSSTFADVFARRISVLKSL